MITALILNYRLHLLQQIGHKFQVYIQTALYLVLIIEG